MRSGRNPNTKMRADVNVSPVQIGVVTHLPNLDGYHSQRLEVVQACLTTMRARAGVNHIFTVWDNGSCREFRDWLKDFNPDILILSNNVGKTNGRTSLYRMCPPDTIFCYSDDDILYYDNWLAPQIELLEHFPDVACVTGYPVRTAFRWATENTRKWAELNGDVRFGKFIPKEWEDDFAISLGRTTEFQEQYTVNDLDYQVDYKGKTAYLTSHHCQFIGYTNRISPAFIYDDLAMADEKPFDYAMDRIGLRLATTQRLSRHIGNVMDDKLKSEAILKESVLWQLA